ncbi:phosphatase PAP2 family protein [Neotamlana laminarinivorans]|uniref:Phosphatase PAP2 family protein n=1 Tax=Neotamlana laminarinivorans TaxID=2883124 RepID=A0A9X1L450_9FLAO|nr:phosphatase PAP2 family protein [Tamlana laminarinivorans]MCB4797951.1 phosphatase PAP2 family protein [Tamlana laminarinivorans]
MKKIFILIAVCFIFFANYVNAQNKLYEIDQDSSSVWGLFKYDVNTTWHGVKYAFTKPVTWKGKDFAKLGGLVAGTAILSLADESVNEFAQRQVSDFPGIVRDFGWYFGSPQNYFMANAGLYGFGLLTKNEKVRYTSVLIISSSVTTGFLQSLAKNAFGRARPGTDLGPYNFKPFSSEGGQHSFPSGHTVLSITMAHAIAKQFKNPWVKSGIYTIGAIPPISRLIDNAHWLTDIAFSTVVSIIVVDTIDAFLKRNNAYNLHQKPKNISWNITFGGNKIGLVGTF